MKTCALGRRQRQSAGAACEKFCMCRSSIRVVVLYQVFYVSLIFDGGLFVRVLCENNRCLHIMFVQCINDYYYSIKGTI